MLSRTGSMVALLTCAASLLVGCAAQATPPVRARSPNPFEQPFRDLSLIREATPEALTRAASAPYLQLFGCETIHAEVERLDAALGPDIDQSQPKGDGAGVVADLIGGALGLPYRGIVRKITGAEARDKALKAATLSGMVRRGYLKGLAKGQGCPVSAGAAW